MRLTIRTRLLLLILGITIPFALLGVFNLRRVWRIGRTQLENSMKQQAELASLAFARWVDAQREPLDTIAAIADDEKSFETVEYIVRTRPHWIDLSLVNASGDVVRSYPPDKQPPSAVIQHLLIETRKRNSWVLVTDRTIDESRPIIALATPLKSGGAAIARVDGVAINDLFREVQLPGDAVIAVFDSQGQILLRKQTANAPLVTEVGSSPLFEALGDQRIAVVELQSPYDAIHRVYGLCRAGPTDFVVAVGVPSATLYEPMQRQFTRYVLFSCLAVCCAVLAAILMQRKIVQPIQRLSIAADALGKGHFGVLAPTDDGGEIADLGVAFNKMAHEIQEREERLNELARLKSELVSSVSHELRTPLTTIKTLTHVLQRTEPSESERREYLETIAEETDRQIALITNLLDLSRIESGAYRINFSPVDAVQVIQDCARLSKHAAENRHQQIRTELLPGHTEVLANEIVLRRIVSTIVENAIKYTPDYGEIVLGLERDDEEVRIYIKDNGAGIDPADLPHIFDRFYQGHAPSVGTEQPGAGLGLYVVRGLVEQLQGRISVESEVGRGSKFVVHLQSCHDRRPVNAEEFGDAETLAHS